MTEKAPGIFSAHAGNLIRFFDTVSEAQDWAENHPSATLRWEYAKLSAKQLAGQTTRGKKKRS